MACRLIGAKPLSEPMLEFCWIWPLGTDFSEISIGTLTFSFKKMRLKVSSAKWRPFCLGLNVLMNHRLSCPIWYWSLLTQKRCLQFLLYHEGNNCTSRQTRRHIHFSPVPPFTNMVSLIPAWISNCIHYQARDEITYPFLNLNGATVEV